MMDDESRTVQDNGNTVDRERLRGVADTLAGMAHFQEALDALERLEQQLLELPGRLQYLNSRRVTYDVAIGTAIGQLTQRLRVAAEDARAIAERESHHLLPRIEALAAMLQGDEADRNMEGDDPRTDGVARALEEADTLKTRIERTDADIRSAFHEVVEEMATVIHQISHLEHVGEWVKAATWEIQASELVLDANRADYQRRPHELHKGYLFLTTHRLLFERREGAKKSWFSLPWKKAEPEPMWEIPLARITDVLLNQEENFLRVVTEGQPIATFIIADDAEPWQQTILSKINHGKTETH
jgi:hypothetical protein